MLPQALTGIRRSFDGPARARAIGWYASALSTGAVVGQLAGGALISANIAGLGWRTIFLINLPVCAAVMLAARRYLPVDHGQDRVGVDVAGSALLSTCILLVVLPLTLGRGQGWPTWTWLSLAAAVPAFVLFLRRQHTSGDAGRPVIINLAAVGRPEVRFGLLANAFATSTYYALLFMVADYEQRGLGNTGLRSSLVLLPWVAAFGLAGQITRRVPAKLARHLPVAGGVLLASTYLVITVSLWTGRSGDGVLALVFAAGGLGLGMQFTTLLANMMNAAPARFAPDVSGAASTIAQVAGVVGIAAFGSLYLGLDGSGGSAAHASRALAVTAIVLTASSAVGAAVAHRAMRPVRPDRSETEPTSSGDEQSGPRMSRVSLDHVAVPAQRRRVAGQ
jgi:predicted MFS family arabinose efflux permease